MNFLARLTALIISAFLVPDGHLSHADESRLQQVAQDMVAAAEAHPLFTGEEEPATRATALSLFAIAKHESGFWANVQDCTLCFPGSAWCDRGRSITLFQLRQGSSSWGPYTRTQLCTNNSIATIRALRVLYRYRKSPTSIVMFDSYARGGAGSAPCRAAREINSIFETAMQREGLRVGWRDGGMTATRVAATTR